MEDAKLHAMSLESAIFWITSKYMCKFRINVQIRNDVLGKDLDVTKWRRIQVHLCFVQLLMLFKGKSRFKFQLQWMNLLIKVKFHGNKMAVCNNAKH